MTGVTGLAGARTESAQSSVIRVSYSDPLRFPLGGECFEV